MTERQHYTCDRCQAVVIGPPRAWRRHKVEIFLTLPNLCVSFYDLCEGCSLAFVEWLKL